MSAQDLKSMMNKRVSLKIGDQIKLEGELVKMRRFGAVEHHSIATFKNARVTKGEKVLFDPAWGEYDFVFATQVESVSAGPADRDAYPQDKNYDVIKVEKPQAAPSKAPRELLFKKIRTLKSSTSAEKESLLSEIFDLAGAYPQDWLLWYQLRDVSENLKQSGFLSKSELKLDQIKKSDPEIKRILES